MMKIDDIPQLTGDGHYVADMEFAFLISQIDDWIKEYGLVLNPDFQRGHVWTKAQQVAFVEFVLRGGVSTPIQFNHPGWMTNWEGDFVCVDGLQRLTAMLAFGNNEFKVFGGYYLKDFDNPRMLLRRQSIKIRINDLKTHEEVLTWYLEMNTGGTPHSKQAIDKVKKMLEELTN